MDDGFESDGSDYKKDRQGKVWAAAWERVEDYRQALKILDRVFPLGEEDKRKALANLALAYAIEKGVRPSDLELVTYRDADLLEVGYRFRVRKQVEDHDDTPESAPETHEDGSLDEH